MCSPATSTIAGTIRAFEDFEGTPKDVVDRTNLAHAHPGTGEDL